MNETELKALRRKCRHKAEWWLFGICAAVSLAVLALVVYYGLVAETDPNAAEYIAKLLGTTKANVEPWLELRGVVAVVALVYFVWNCFIKTMMDISGAYRRELPASKEQYPFIEEIYRGYAEKLGLDKTPEIFISTGGFVKYEDTTLYNVFVLRIAPAAVAAYGPGRDLQMRTQIAEFAAVRFLGYADRLFFVLMAGVKWVPIVSKLHDKAMTYSVDRVTEYLLGEEDAFNGIALLMNDPKLGKSLNIPAYEKDVNAPMPFRYRLFGFFDELRADSPLPKHRLAALRDPEKKSGRLI